MEPHEAVAGADAELVWQLIPDHVEWGILITLKSAQHLLKKR